VVSLLQKRRLRHKVLTWVEVKPLRGTMLHELLMGEEQDLRKVGENFQMLWHFGVSLH
jgi:hypothetical protein